MRVSYERAGDVRAKTLFVVVVFFSIQFLSQLSKAPGCSVILAGDYHWGDIKALLPGADTPYAEWYASEDNEFPVFQVRLRCVLMTSVVFMYV